MAVKLHATPQRFWKLYGADDPAVPNELFNTRSMVPDLSGIEFPLPSRKKDYTCCAVGGDGAYWMGSPHGLTRYDPTANEYDRVMYFCANRYLYDNNVLAVVSDDADGVWVLTETGVSHIEMKVVSPREKADMLCEETARVVKRREMVSHKYLKYPRDTDEPLPYGHCDNDGGFTAIYAAGEIFRYAVLKRENADEKEIEKAFKSAVSGVEAVLLLMYISKRGDGFVARSCLTPDEPVPDDGLFYRIQGDKAVCLETYSSEKREMAGMEIPAAAPIPERLRRLYTSQGYTDEGMVYKGDTSSDEITIEFMMLYWAHKILADADPELDELIRDRVDAIASHIVKNGYVLMECNGKPTTWAKWCLDYFNSPDGWTDACLNSAELLMYIRAAGEITGDKEKWQKEYDKLIEMGYAELPEKHYDRAYQTSLLEGYDIAGELMYGDNMLSVCSFWILITLETDPELKKKYINAFRTWKGTVCRENKPGYDFPYALCCGVDEIDVEADARWLERTNISRLASGVSLNDRFDIAKRIRRGGYEETSVLLPPDEQFIAKFDRNSYRWCEEDSGGVMCVEGCFPYTFSYWLGIYFGLIED